MANPWSILGLDPDTANEKQVRSAYAKLLKIYRPDQDPEGFQRLRTAYELALKWLQQRSPTHDDDWADDVVNVLLQEPSVETPPAVSTSPIALPSLLSSWAEGEVPVLPHKLGEEPVIEQRRHSKPERNWPRQWSYSLESLDCALKGTPRHMDVIAQALSALASDVMECGIPPFALECILSDAFDEDMKLFGMSAPVAILFCLLRGGCAGFVQSAMDALEKAGNQAHLAVLVQKLDDCLTDALSPSTVDVFFRAAGLMALHKPFIAHSILRKLQHLLDASEYSIKLDSLQIAITRGLAFRDLVPEHRSFWSQRLDHPDAACDWTADFPRQALAAVFILGKGWAGFSLVRGVVPEEVWKNATKGRWIQFAFHRVVKRLRPNNPHGMMFAVMGGVFLFCGMKLFDGMVSALGPAPMSAEQTEELKRDHQREIELVRKHVEELKQRSERIQSGSK